MFGFFSPLNGVGGNGARVYQCIACGALIAHSDQLLRIGTSNRHLFVNPAGVECDFHTFSSCQGGVAHGPATEADTWFPGYRWRMAFCRHCGQYLGWHYKAVSMLERPNEFWGILVNYLVRQ
jgi:hypothetical protein